MKKQYRVKKSNEIELILKNHKFFGNKYFTIYKKENFETSNFRYALSVGKKIGNAVLRNKVKRQVRSIVDSLNIDLSMKVDIFIVVRPQVNNITYQEMTKELEYLFKKHNIICKGEK